MTRWAAVKLWGDEVVALALEEPEPDPVTAELVQEAQTYLGSPGALRSWALALPWPRFCAVVRIVSGTTLSEALDGDE